MVQPANNGKDNRPERKLVRVPIPTAALRAELVGMMSAPAPGSKPYWVFGLPIWRHYQTSHLLQNDGTPQLELELKDIGSLTGQLSKKTPTKQKQQQQQQQQQKKKKKKKKKQKQKSDTHKSEL